MGNDVKNVSGAQFPQPPEEFAVRSATSAYKFLKEGVPPPFPCYVGVDDNLLLTYIFAGNSIFALCNVRILRPDGEIIPLVFSFGSATPNVVVTQRFQLAEGFLLSVSIVAQNPTSTGSPTYAAAALVRPPNTALAQYETLCAGYINSVVGISYPTHPPQRATDGPGIIRSIATATPGAGAEFSFTVPANSRDRIVALSASLTTAVAVANRNVDLIIDDGVSIIAEITSGFSQAASLTNRYSWMDSGPSGALFDGMVVLPLPAQLYLFGGFRVRSATTAIQPADQWTAATILVQQWNDMG